MVYPMGIMSGLGSPFASSIREAALVGNRERVDPYKGTRFEGFTGLGNDGYGSLSQGPMDNILADGFFVNDPRRPRPGMRGSSDSGTPAIPTMDGTELTNVPSAEIIAGNIFDETGYNVDMADVRSSLKNILADRNTTPEERSRRMYMGPGKPSPRVGPPPPPLYDTPGSASGIEIKGGPNYIADQDVSKILGLTPPTQDPDRADFYAFKNTLRDPGDMGRYVAPGEEMSYEDFVKFGRPANLAAAEAAGYSGGALLSDNLGNKVSLNSLINATPEEALKGGGLLPNSGFPENLEGTAEAGGILGGTAVAGGLLPNVVNAPVDPGFSPNLMGAGRRPVDPYARPTPGMLPQPIEINPNYRPDNFRPNPNMYQRPMRRPFGFGGRPMNPFMGMGIGMMNPMGMGMFGGFPMRPPMFGGYGGYGGGYGGYGGGYNMMRPPMGFGLGGANPYGMNPYINFGRPNPYPQPSYNRPNPYSSGMSFNQPNFMQQQQGGYGSYQQPSGYGNYGGMQNPYQPQQMGNTNNFAGYGQQQAMF